MCSQNVLVFVLFSIIFLQDFFLDEIRIVGPAQEPLTPPITDRAAPFAVFPCVPVVGGESSCTNDKCFARDANSVCNGVTKKCECRSGYALTDLGVCEDGTLF
jgi:hypothetical protein